MKSDPHKNILLENGDKMIKIGDVVLNGPASGILKNYKPGDKTMIVYERLGKQEATEVTFVMNPSYAIGVNENATDEQKATRSSWLESKE